MKYDTQVTIDVPVTKVVELFTDQNNISKWMDGLVSFEQISGKAGKRGSKTKLKFNQKGRESEIMQTILDDSFPDSFSASYTAKGIDNTESGSFVDNGDGKTIWKNQSEFIFTTFFMKVIGVLFRSSFPKQTQKSMDDFKKFAESQAKTK